MDKLIPCVSCAHREMCKFCLCDVLDQALSDFYSALEGDDVTSHIRIKELSCDKYLSSETKISNEEPATENYPYF